MSLLHSITHTTAAGAARIDNTDNFNDVVAVGKFPVQQKISRVSKIEVWAKDRVVGIRFTYELEDKTQKNPMHGRDDGTRVELKLSPDALIVGAFGRRDSEGNVGSLSFVVFEGNSGRVTVNKLAQDPPQTGTAFGTFGRVIAISGTKESEYGLCSLSFVKDDAATVHLLS